jgi:hypothetical protein
MQTLLLALVLNVITPERAYAPYTPPWRGGGHAVAATPSGALLAWSAVDAASGRPRIHTALVDSDGRMISPVTVLPSFEPRADAIVPGVGTDGTSFFVAWEEIYPQQRTVGIAVDARGVAGRPRVLAGPAQPDNVYDPVRVTWLGDAYALDGDSGPAVRIDREGNVLGAISGPFPAAVASDGRRGSAELRVVPGTPGFGGFGNFQPLNRFIDWTAGTLAGSEALGQQPAGVPHIAAAHDDFLITWTTRDLVHYRLASGAANRIAARVDDSSRPSAACSATQCIVVYGTLSGDVHGFTFERDRPFAVQLFVAAASERMEREPRVVMLANDRALVTYRSIGADERLGARVLGARSVKMRAVR